MSSITSLKTKSGSSGGFALTKRAGMITIGAVLVCACAAPPPTRPVSNAAQADSDLVRMPSMGRQGATTERIGARPMTYEELEYCARSLQAMNNANRVLEIASDSLRRAKERIETEGRAIDTERPKVVQTNALAVKAFNDRINRHNESIRATNATINEWRSRSGIQERHVGSFNTNCANRHYRQSDFARLPEDLKKPTEAKSQVSDIPLIEDQPTSGK